MRGALSVRISDGTSDRFVTKHTKGLRFRKVANGGHHSASCTVTVPRDMFVALGPNDPVSIYDTRTGKTAWDGYTENPGRTDGPAGQAYDLSAIGGMVLAQDNSTPVVFLERALDDDRWLRRGVAGGTTETVDDYFQFQFPSGIPIATGSEVGLEYVGLRRTGQRLHVCEAQVVAGKSDTLYRLYADSMQAGVYQNICIDSPFDTGNVIVSATVGTDFPAGVDGILLMIHRSGGTTNVADDNTWGRWLAPYLRPVLLKKDGSDDTAPFAAYAVLAHEVVNHLLGAMLPGIDGANAQVDVTPTWITQLTYHDGAKPQQILDDLALFEPDFLWEVLERNTAGLHRFAYRAWPTEPRYEISVKDGYNAPGGEADLCNRVIVYWNDAQGQTQSTAVTSTVAALGSRVRDAEPITLPEGMGSLDNATRVGEMILAAKASAPKAATAVVRRRIWDHLKGQWVMPWEIEPGYLVRVRETGDDLRLTEVEYVDDDCAATLTLGEPVLTTDQYVARVKASTYR